MIGMLTVSTLTAILSAATRCTLALAESLLIGTETTFIRLDDMAYVRLKELIDGGFDQFNPQIAPVFQISPSKELSLKDFQHLMNITDTITHQRMSLNHCHSRAVGHKHHPSALPYRPHHELPKPRKGNAYLSRTRRRNGVLLNQATAIDRVFAGIHMHDLANG